MKKLVLMLTMILSLSANALIIKGENSDDQFIYVEKLEKQTLFSICNGSFKEFYCDSFYPVPIGFTVEDIRKMSDEKYREMWYAIGADAGLIFATWKLLIPLGALAGKNAGLAAFAGYSLDGGVLALPMATGGVGGLGTGASIMALTDDLDPFSHRDASLSLDTIVGDNSRDELEDLEAKNVTLWPVTKSPVANLGVEQVLTIEGVPTSWVYDSFKGMLDDIIKDRDYSHEEIILGE